MARSYQIQRGSTIEVCGRWHRTLLYVTSDVSQPDAHISINHVSGYRLMTKVTVASEEPRAALAIVPVILCYGNRTKETLSFFNSGSNSTLVLRELVNEFELEVKGVHIRLATINHYSGWRAVTWLDLRSCESDYCMHVERAYAVPVLSNARRVEPNVKQLQSLCHLKDVELKKCKTERVGLLIGCDVLGVYRISQQKSGKLGEPHVIRTIFVWTLSEPFGAQARNQIKLNWLHPSELEKTVEIPYQDVLDERQTNRNDMPVEEKLTLKTMEGSVVSKIFQTFPFIFNGVEEKPSFEIAK